MNGKRAKIIGNFLVFLGGLILLSSAGVKFAHVPKIVSELGAMGFGGDKLIFIASLEVVSALLFLVPGTRSAGLLLVSSYLGGAIATHVQHDQPFIQPAAVLFVIWLGAWLRHPQVLWSFSQSVRGLHKAAAPAEDLKAGS